MVIRSVLDQAQVKLHPTDAALVLRERYETMFKIYDHDHPSAADRPLASIAMHWAENNSAGSLLYERIEQFEERKIYQRFGVSLAEFLELPRDVCSHLMEVAGKRIKEESTVAAAAAEQMKALGKKA